MTGGPRATGLGVGDVLAGRYELVERIGAGGMATIFEGFDRSLERRVAVKVLHAHLADDPVLLERFRTEARHAAALLHPNIVNVFDQGVAEGSGLPFIVMEHVDGASLRQVLLARGRLSPREALAMLLPVCEALSRAHAGGVVHRDVKPENILVTADGEPKVADFGIARAVAETSMTQTGTLIGSVHYLAPELVGGGTATAASDQYAVGILLFELLTGRKPLTGDSPMAVAVRHARESIPPPSRFVSDVDRRLDTVVARATAADPAERFPDVTALAAALRAAVPEGPSPVVPPAALPSSGDTLVLPPDAQDTIPGVAADDLAARALQPRRRRRRTRRLGGILAVVLVVVGLFAAGAWAGWNFLLAPVTAVPELVGETEADALATLEAEGLSAGEVERVNTLEVPAEEVLGQAPAAGAEVRRGDAVDLTVSLGPAEVEVPSVVGSAEQAAVAQLSGEPHHLQVTVEQAFSDDVAAGLVLDQDPAAGAAVRQLDTVTITVSLGVEQVTVPDLSGMDQDDAEAALADAGLAGDFASEHSDEVPEAGQVIRQSVDPGSEVDRGSTVAVTTSLGPLTVEAPNLRGQSLEQARAALTDLGLELAVEEQPRPQIGPFRRGQFGRVEEQVPEPGAAIRRGQTVTIYTFSEAAEQG